jgi:hypothetical protein
MKEENFIKTKNTKAERFLSKLKNDNKNFMSQLKMEINGQSNLLND